MIDIRYWLDARYPMLQRLQIRRRRWWLLWSWSQWEDVATVSELDGTFRPSL